MVYSLIVSGIVEDCEVHHSYSHNCKDMADFLSGVVTGKYKREYLAGTKRDGTPRYLKESMDRRIEWTIVKASCQMYDFPELKGMKLYPQEKG